MQTRNYFNDGIGEAVHFGWAAMKGNWVFFVVVTLVAGVIDGLVNGAAKQIPAMATVLGLISFAIGIIFRMGFTKMFLNTVGNEKEPEVADFYTVIPLFFNYLIATILFTLMVIIGSILLIIPGIVLGAKYCFYGYFIIDEGLGPMDALRASAELTDGIKWDIFGLFIVISSINFLGLMALGVGLFATIPATGIAFAYVYRNLVTRVETVSIPTGPAGPTGGPTEPTEEETPPAGPILNARKDV